MNLLEIILTAWRALLANKTRSFLTLLGVMMGVGTIVLLSSLISGGLASIKRTVASASGDDVISVSIGWSHDGHQDPKLNSNDMRALSQASGLARATVLPELDWRTDARANGETQRVRVVGTNEGALGFYRLELASGRFITSLDRAESRRVAVLGRDVARKLFPEGALGHELHVGTERFNVVGLLSNKPTLNVGNHTWNNAVVVPDSTFMAWRGQQAIDTIVVKTNDTTDPLVKVNLAAATIRAVLTGRNHPDDTLKVDDNLHRSGAEAGFLGALRLLMYTVAILCLGVGGINIMNIMLVTVSERTREIGLRMAIGARKRDIRRQFLIEAAAVSGLGGLLGVGGGVLLGWTVSLVLTKVVGYWPYMLDPVAVAVAFASALATGVVFGWYPAQQAANLQPIECLRYE